MRRGGHGGGRDEGHGQSHPKERGHWSQGQRHLRGQGGAGRAGGGRHKVKLPHNSCFPSAVMHKSRKSLYISPAGADLWIEV